MSKIDIQVKGMSCASCVGRVEKALNAIDGVDKANINFEKGLLTVKYDPLKVSDDMIVDKLSGETTYIVKKREKDFSKIIFNWLKVF